MRVILVDEVAFHRLTTPRLHIIPIALYPNYSTIKVAGAPL